MTPAVAKKKALVRRTGRIVRLHDNGFGFIAADDSTEEFYVHVKEVERSAWALRAHVSFLPGEQTDPGKAPRAFKVRLAVEGEA